MTHPPYPSAENVWFSTTGSLDYRLIKIVKRKIVKIVFLGERKLLVYVHNTVAAFSDFITTEEDWEK